MLFWRADMKRRRSMADINIATDSCSAVTVGIETPPLPDDARLRICSVKSAAEALRMVRKLDADLLVTGMQLPDASPWQMIRRLRIARPWQKWALTADALTTAQEIEARSLGVVAILGETPTVESLLMLASTIRDARVKRNTQRRTPPEPATRRLSNERAAFYGSTSHRSMSESMSQG